MSPSVGRPTPRTSKLHWPLFAGALAWIAVLGWYWQEFIPFKPDATFVVHQGMRFEGLSPAGEMMFSHSGEPRYSSAMSPGPVEFRSLPEGRVVRTAFEETDQVAPGLRSADGRTLIRRDGAFWLANLTGEVLHKLPGLEGNQVRRASILKGNRLVWEDATGVTLYDVQECRDIVRLANAPGEEWRVVGVSEDIATLKLLREFTNEAGQHDLAGEWQLLHLSNGEIDGRFSQLQHHIVVSPDDRFIVMADHAGKVTTFDGPTATQLWSINAGNYSGRRFEDQGQVLAFDRQIETGMLSVSRWRIVDGTPLGETRDGPRSHGLASRTLIDGSDYAIDSVADPGPSWKRQLVDVSRLLTEWIGTRSLPPVADVSRNTLFDLAHNRPLGMLAEGRMESLATPDGRGVLTWDDERRVRSLRYYSLPPKRNWMWFVKPGIAPLFLLLAGIWLRRRRRTRTT